MNKNEFMNKLKESLSEYGVTDTREILLDFEQHFEDGAAAGETEAQVCEKLGDPAEIAKQYIPEGEITEEPRKAKSSAQPPLPPKNVKHGPSAEKIIGVLCIDLFVLSWALPTLISLVFSLYGITVGFGVSGIAIFIGGLLMNLFDTSKWFFSTFSPLSTSLLGVVFMSGSVLCVIGCIASTKGVIGIIKSLINWHSEAFAGKKIIKTEKKEQEGVA